jgi:diaminopimelate epimerase
MQKNEFVKSHGLGNDYIVLDPDALSFRLTPAAVKRISDRNHGVGSDGILAIAPSKVADFGVRIYNPDGSEAEKSGNGLRIFAKFLYEHRLANRTSFTIETLGGIVRCDVRAEDRRVSEIRVDMGLATFKAGEIPVAGKEREVLGEAIEVGGRNLRITAASLGNPHCVVFTDDLEQSEFLRLGPLLERHPIFPRRTNVQFAQVLSRDRIRIRIWERGAGHTIASGSSACAVAAAAFKQGFVDQNVQIQMEGGSLRVEITLEFRVFLTGPASEICSGVLSSDLVEILAESDRLSV